jgi:hypothetical protein
MCAGTRRCGGACPDASKEGLSAATVVDLVRVLDSNQNGKMIRIRPSRRSRGDERLAGPTSTTRSLPR